MYKSSKIGTAKTKRLNFVSHSRLSRDCVMMLNYWDDDDEMKTFHNKFVNISQSIHTHWNVKKTPKTSGAVFFFQNM